MVTLAVQNISKAFAKKEVLKDVSFKASSGEIVGLIGKSGCGKSTLLKICVGYLKPDNGSLFLDKHDVSEDTILLRRSVGYTTQENSFYEKLTVMENMHYYASLYRVPKEKVDERIIGLLEKVALVKSMNVMAEKLSGGMKRRLDFAISLIHDPEVLILDEPTAGLDPVLIDQFWAIVKKVVKEQKKIAIVASHILSEIQKNCDKAIVIHHGTATHTLTDLSNLDSRFRELVR